MKKTSRKQLVPQPHRLRTSLASVSTLVWVTVWTQPVFASTGGGGGQMGQGITSMFDKVIGFLTGPIVTAFATIMFIGALIGAYFSGGSDALKKVLTVVAITAGIMAAPGIVDQVVTAASSGSLLP